MGLPQGMEGTNNSGSEADPVQMKHNVNVQETISYQSIIY
jgi:hypothetical protein